MERLRLSPSGIAAFQECPTKYFYRSRRWEPKSKPAPLYVGSLGHLVLKGLYTEGWPGAQKELQAIREQFDQLLPEERESYGDVPGVLEFLIGNYIGQYDDSKRVDPRNVEKGICVAINKQISLYGIADVIFPDGEIIDHKFTARIPKEDEALLTNAQLNMYGFLVEQGMGIPMKRITLNFLKREIYKTKGHNPCEYFQRYSVPYSRATGLNIVADVLAVAEMIKWAENHEYFPHTFSFRCKMCSYKTVCSAAVRGINPYDILEANFKQREGGEYNGEIAADDD